MTAFRLCNRLSALALCCILAGCTTSTAPNGDPTQPGGGPTTDDRVLPDPSAPVQPVPEPGAVDPAAPPAVDPNADPADPTDGTVQSLDVMIPLPARLPEPRRTYLGYLPDGGYKLSDGPGAMPLRPIALRAVPALARYGFGRYMSPAYIGISRSNEDAFKYYNPLQQLAKANNMTFVPGLWMHHLIDVVYGVPNEPPWNVTGPEYDLSHPQNPIGMLNPAVWDQLYERSLALARGAQTNQVYVDSEFVFYRFRTNPFWTDENLAAMKPMAREAIRKLREKGVHLVMYHPNFAPTDPDIRRIAVGLFAPDSADDPLTLIEHFAPSPYFKSLPNTKLPEPADIDATHAVVGVNLDQVRYGFMSNHALFGMSAQDYDDYCNARPGIAERTWFFTTYGETDRFVKEFSAIVDARDAQ